jgi:hypothetical protein
VKTPKLAGAIAVAAVTALLPVTPATAYATTINCHHTGPVVGHPGMNYICYVHHDNAPMEIFYAP